MVGHDDAERRIAELVQEALVGQPPLADERDLALETELGVLSDEPHRIRPEDGDRHRVRVAPDLRQVRHEIRDAQRRIELLDDLAAGRDEGPRHAPDVLVARREIGGDEDQTPVALLVRPLAQRM